MKLCSNANEKSGICHIKCGAVYFDCKQKPIVCSRLDSSHHFWELSREELTVDFSHQKLLSGPKRQIWKIIVLTEESS